MSSCAALICTACALTIRRLIFGSVRAFVVRKVLQNPLYDPGVPLTAPVLAVCPRDPAAHCGGLGCDERSHRNPQGCFGKSPTTPRLRNDITRWELFELRDDARACRCLRCGARNHAKRMPQLLHASATNAGIHASSHDLRTQVRSAAVRNNAFAAGANGCFAFVALALHAGEQPCSRAALRGSCRVHAIDSGGPFEAGAHQGLPWLTESAASHRALAAATSSWSDASSIRPIRSVSSLSSTEPIVYRPVPLPRARLIRQSCRMSWRPCARCAKCASTTFDPR